MIRPEVSVESYAAIDELYGFYDEHIQSQVFARTAHFLLSKIYKPTTSFALGAEDAIRQDIDDGRKLAIDPNHLTGDDQYVVVAVAEKEQVFHPLRGNTIIPTEPSLSSASLKRGGQLLRWACDGLGSIPITRNEDYFERQGVELTPERKELVRYGAQRASQTWEYKITEQPNHIAFFPESNRNRTDHTKVQPHKTGVIRSLLQASNQVGISMVPWGMYFGGEPTDYNKLDVPDKYTPHVHVGMPIQLEQFSSPDEVVSVLRPAMQACVDVAVRACQIRAA